METLGQVLIVYSWFIIMVLIAFLGRIAYFYEKTSGRRTGYRLLIVPALLLTAGAAYYLARQGDFTGEPVGDLLLFGGGALLSIFGYRLHAEMTGER
ncbi:MAG: hypothetical protein N2508_01030 [Anaerolineae bacterium]|nr:hypothetical protein [Anaerolineae bacterium]